MKISIVTTLYHSSAYVNEFYTRISAAAQQLVGEDYEIIFVDDGSPDDSLSKCLELYNHDKKVKVIELSRNFGHHNAIQAGLRSAEGDFVFLVDCDLEVSPDCLLELHHQLVNNKNVDVVYGYQEDRKGGFVERKLGGLFWKVFNKLSDTQVPANILTERLMTQRYVKSLCTLGDSNLFLAGMMAWVGYNQIGIPIKKKQRKGMSTYNTVKRITLMIDAICSFSGKPLRILFYFGVFVCFVSLFSGLYIIYNKLFQDSYQAGWASLVVINMMLLGVISIFLGLIGIYLHKVFRQVQNRPNYIIKTKHE